MFNFKLTPLWLFGIIIITLIVSMLWYNNASIEGFGLAPASGSDVLKYYPDASKILVDFGVSNKNFIDTNTGNIIRDYDQTMSVINRAGNVRKFIKSDLETAISVKNDEVHKGSTYPAFSLYEEGDDEQLFYISVGTKTFIHSMDLTSNKHGNSYAFDSGRLLKLKFEPNVDVSGVAINTGTASVSLNSEVVDISGISVTAMKLTDGLYYDASNQLLIQNIKLTATATPAEAATTAAEAATAAATGTDVPKLKDALVAAKIALTKAVSDLTTASKTTAAAAATLVVDKLTATVLETTMAAFESLTATKKVEILSDALTTAASALTTAANALNEGTAGFTLFNNRLLKEEFEGFTTMDGKVRWDIFDRTTAQKLAEFNANEYTAGANSENLVVKTLNNADNTAQVIMMTHSDDTVIIILTNVGNGGKNKYKLLGTLRYIGTKLEEPVTPPEQQTATSEETKEDETKEEETKETDLTDSAMSEYWKWFHYWNADGGSQPMSQDYMLKTDYVPMTCPSCSGDGKCTNCGNGHNQGSSSGGGSSGGSGGGGGIVGTTGGIANNIIDKTSGLAAQSIDTGAGLAVTGAIVGGATAAGVAGLGKDAVSGAIGLGKDAASGAKSATVGAVDLGREVVSGAVGLGKDAASGAKSATVGAVGLGREVVSGAVGLGKDVVGGTADLIKNTQYANAGGYASGSNGDLQTRKYVKGQGGVPGGMDPYTYNGLLSKRGGSNYLPLTSDFSSFR